MHILKNKFLIFISFAFGYFLFTAINLYAAEYTITQLSNNNYQDYSPRLNNSQVTWYGWDGNDYEIFVYNGVMVNRLTDNAYNDYVPQIQNGQVVWYGWDGNDYEIFLYDGNQTVQFTNNNSPDSDPKIHNGQVVWCHYEMDSWGWWQSFIFFYDGIQTFQLMDFSALAGYEIHNGQVVWWRYDGNDPEIFLYDGIRTIQLTNNDYWDGYPYIHNGQVVWFAMPSSYSSDRSEIFLYDGSQIKQLTNNSYPDEYPKIHNGQIIWLSGGRVLFYDGVQTIQLTGTYGNKDPQIYGGQVVWRGWDGHDYEIYLYDGKQIIQLTNNNYNDYDPQIHNGQVVWRGYDGSDYEIYLAKPKAALEVLDGVDFSAGREISNDLERLAATKGTVVIGATADGITRLLLKLPLSGLDELTFSLEGEANPGENGTLRAIDGSQEGNSIIVTSSNTSQGEIAFAIYQAPENFARQDHPEDQQVSERTISLKVKSNRSPDFEFTQEIKLVRPPVVLVHGLWSGPEMWWENGFVLALASEWPGILIFRVDYEDTNARHFDVNKNKIKDIIAKIREQYRLKQAYPEGIAMVQVDVLGHSMGGLLARIYSASDKMYADVKYKRDDNFWAGDINKLITLDSPHYGSFFADIGIECINNLNPSVREWVLRQFRDQRMPLDEGAIEDLMVVSDPIRQMNKLSIHTPNHVIIGDYPVGNFEFWFLPGTLGWAHRTLSTLGYDTRPYVVENHSDLVISVESQTGSLGFLASSSFEHHHMNVTRGNVANRVIELLNIPTDSNLFEEGFPLQ
ncbi:MAG: alpha/beta fold hydrolase [Candidatus Omnitrophota bacterium]